MACINNVHLLLFAQAVNQLVISVSWAQRRAQANATKPWGTENDGPEMRVHKHFLHTSDRAFVLFNIASMVFPLPVMIPRCKINLILHRGDACRRR